MKLLLIIAIIVIVLLFLWLVYFAWYLAGGYNADNKCEDEIIKLKREIRWWKNQMHGALKEVNDWKRKFNDMQCKYNKERNRVFECEQNLEAYIQWKKIKWKTIAEKNKENIISLFNEWLTDKEIAKIIGCGRSTIQRAVKKFWLR